MCRSCGYSEVVALSCKKRGFCPSYLGRRMADTAVHLEERVLPAGRVRRRLRGSIAIGGGANADSPESSWIASFVTNAPENRIR